MVVISVLSLAGIPPTAGFFAKYFIFATAMQNGLMPLVLIAIGGSLIGVLYYFRLIIAIFREGDGRSITTTPLIRVVMIIAAVVALVLGVAPGMVVGLL
jgi:NADH-quinone oxidoreductase subunit N